MISNFFPIAAFFAGIVSVLSPCILPIIPAVFAYSTGKGKLRPLAIVLGLSLSFTSMGVITSIFGATLTAYIGYLNVFAEALLVIIFLEIFQPSQILSKRVFSEGFYLVSHWGLSGSHVSAQYLAQSLQWLLFQERLVMEH